MVKPKLCYVIPEYRENAHTHFAYLVPFIAEVAKEFDVRLIIERGTLPHGVGVTDVVLCDDSVPFVRFLKIKWAIVLARLQGYRDFYVHYSFFAAYVAALSVRVTGGRVFYWNCGEPWKYKRGAFRELFERATYKFVTYLVTGTEGMKELYAKHYDLDPEKIKVMPNWINVAEAKRIAKHVDIKSIRQALGVEKKEKLVFFAHRLSKRKGAHYIPEIVKALHDEDAVLVVAGGGPERGYIESEIVRLGLRDRVRFLGWAPHEALLRYMAASDIFILPSEEEGFPHVVLETMALGVPFTAFAVGGIKEIVPEDARPYIIPQNSLDLFLEKTLFLLKLPPTEKRALAHVFQAHVRRYDMFSITEVFKALFR